jgi:hypothetical protein
MTIEEMSRMIDEGFGPEDVTIRGYISELRRFLRGKLALSPDHDPVKRIAKGTYRLNVPEVS